MFLIIHFSKEWYITYLAEKSHIISKIFLNTPESYSVIIVILNLQYVHLFLFVRINGTLAITI